MKKELCNQLYCLQCNHQHLEVEISETDANEIRTGSVNCPSCKKKYPIKNGIVELYLNFPKEIEREKKQWEIFAESEGWLSPPTEYLNLLPSPLALKYVPKDTINWSFHEKAFNSILNNETLQGLKILDIGAGRCWSTKHLALKGANCVAIDIMEHKGIGLGTADILMNHSNVFFERCIADMNKLPFVDTCFDLVFVSGSLHHSTDIKAAISEISRVLKPNGRFFMTNEPATWFLGNEVADMTNSQDGINEHNYRMSTMNKVFKNNGLSKHKLIPSPMFQTTGNDYYGGRILNYLVKKMPFIYSFFIYIKGGVLLLKLQKNDF